MASDKPDKTVFRQPSVSSDRTVIRPSPGRRGGGTAPPRQTSPGAPVQTPTAPPASTPSSAPGVQYQPDMQPQTDATGDYFQTSRGLNPLVNAASTLIAVFEKIRGSLSHHDVGGLHQRLVREIKQFDTQAKEMGIRPEIVLAARYCICAALDEAVLNTPWGSESAWPQRTLLSVFHNETAGGEKFFQILQRMLEQPAENLDFIELMYIFLSLGFEGKYRVIHRGREMIEQLRDEVFATIRRLRGEYERSLSSHWQGLGRTRKSLTNYLPIWVVASLLGAVLLVSYSGFRVWLFNSSSPVVEKLEVVADMRTIARPTGTQ